MEPGLDREGLVKGAVNLPQVDVGEVRRTQLPLPSFFVRPLVVQGSPQGEAVKFTSVLAADGYAHAGRGSLHGGLIPAPNPWPLDARLQIQKVGIEEGRAVRPLSAQSPG